MQGLFDNDKLIKCCNCKLAHTYGERKDCYESSLCPRCETEADWDELDSKRDYEWWSVAVYSQEQVYGGPEEGGWWYTAGDIEYFDKVRAFTNFDDARNYVQKLLNWLKEEELDCSYTVKGFTEQFPDAGFPNVRPYYC